MKDHRLRPFAAQLLNTVKTVVQTYNDKRAEHFALQARIE